MRASVRRIAVVGAVDLGLAEALRELGVRCDGVSGDSVFALARQLSALKPRAVHAREAHLKAALVARLLSLPAVLEVGEGDVTSTTAHAARLVDRVLCGSAAVREALLELGAPASSVSVLRGLTRVSGGAGAGVFPPILDPALRWVVCAAPHDGPDRGVADALLAFTSLARTRPRLRLLVNAQGFLARQLLAQAKAAGLEGRVVAHPLERRQLHGVFAHAAAVVAASRSGALPDYVPEALAAGAAIIATAVGQHPTWIREGRSGFLVPARAPVALAARLASVLDDAALATRLREGALRSTQDAASPRACALELSRCYAAVARPLLVHPTGLYLPEPARMRV